MTDSAGTKLLKTPLHGLHTELGARMVPFAGYEMPVQYPAGVKREHEHTRTRAGLFDVSHMGQVHFTGPDRATALEALVPVDVLALDEGHQRYALLTNEQGGILDDLMIFNAGDHLFVVVNAACKVQDLEHMKRNLQGDCAVEYQAGRALLALQGPTAAAVLAPLAAEVERLVFMTGTRARIAGIECNITRSGYTGEDGFEISVPADQAEQLARTLLAHDDVAPVGLGARDSLRLEAGLCLYGNDIDATTTPVEASLTWSLSKARRADGARPGGYPGAAVIMRQLADGVSRRRVGIRPAGRAPVREGCELRVPGGQVVGRVTSGGFGPTVGAPVAMGYVASEFARNGTALEAMVRGRPVPVEVCRALFVEQRYHRG